jgi:hypothetical protein
MTKHQRTARAGTSSQGRRQIAAVVGVLILVVAVLVLKGTSLSTTAKVDSAVAVAPTQAAELDPEGVTPLDPAAGETPHGHLDRMLAEGQPILAFFHSTTCYQCTEMTRIVGEVYPDFEMQVALVGVNVYEERNYALIQHAGIRVIPTLIFIDSQGMAQGFTGVMAADQLRTALTELTLGDSQ